VQVKVAIERGSAVSLDVVTARGRRRPWVVALGLFLASTGTVVIVWLVGVAGKRVEVLVLRQDVPYGQAIALADLGIARVSVDPGVAMVPASDRAAVVGQYPQAPLSTGMLLTPSAYTTLSGPPSGKAIVPLAIPEERMPAIGLKAGDRVLIVDAGDVAQAPLDAGAHGAFGLSTQATVARVGAADLNGVSVVDVLAASSAAPRLAIASVRGQVALVISSQGN
jgi:hypothetical protein